MEDGFADEPEEFVDAGPELGELDECVTAAPDRHGIDDVAEAENETADDDRRNQRSEDLREGGHDSLQRVLIGLRCRLDLCLGDTGYAGDLDEVIIEI